MSIPLFVNKSDEIKVDFVIGRSKSGLVLADLNEKSFRDVMGDELVDVENHHAVFRVPSFADSILNTGMTLENDSVRVNPSQMKLERMCRLIKSWTLKDENGEELQADRVNIENLHPLIGTVILIGLDKALGERGLV